MGFGKVSIGFSADYELISYRFLTEFWWILDDFATDSRNLYGRLILDKVLTNR